MARVNTAEVKNALKDALDVILREYEDLNPDFTEEHLYNILCTIQSNWDILTSKNDFEIQL